MTGLCGISTEMLGVTYVNHRIIYDAWHISVKYEIQNVYNSIVKNIALCRFI